MHGADILARTIRGPRTYVRVGVTRTRRSLLRNDSVRATTGTASGYRATPAYWAPSSAAAAAVAFVAGDENLTRQIAAFVVTTSRAQARPPRSLPRSIKAPSVSNESRQHMRHVRRVDHFQGR